MARPMSEEENLSLINNYMAKIIYVWERRTLGLLIITWLRSSMSERGEPYFINNYMANITYVWERRT